MQLTHDYRQKHKSIEIMKYPGNGNYMCNYVVIIFLIYLNTFFLFYKQELLLFSFKIYFLLKYNWCTKLYVTDVQYSDSLFLKVMLHL